MALIDEGITNECACARGIGEREEENADGRRRRRDDGDEEEEEKVGDLLVKGGKPLSHLERRREADSKVTQLVLRERGLPCLVNLHQQFDESTNLMQNIRLKTQLKHKCLKLDVFSLSIEFHALKGTGFRPQPLKDQLGNRKSRQSKPSSGTISPFKPTHVNLPNPEVQG